MTGNPIHILAPGESLPCCQVVPGGGFRTVQIQMQTNAQFLFLAVRNGTEEGRVRCTWEGPEQIAPIVDWDGSQLKCVAWER